MFSNTGTIEDRSLLSVTSSFLARSIIARTAMPISQRPSTQATMAPRILSPISTPWVLTPVARGHHLYGAGATGDMLFNRLSNTASANSTRIRPTRGNSRSMIMYSTTLMLSAKATECSTCRRRATPML